MAHRRLSAEEKGKGMITDEFQAPRTGRVQVQISYNTELLRKHELTLIGRITNPSVQKMWPLLSFFTDLWKSDTRPVGSDLGNGLFQFQFEQESDLLAVLEKRPYHYARWMIIVQRWEPTLSRSFPSLIPFWIKVQGIPVHLWTKETIQSVGEDIGLFEYSEITFLSARMRVQVNGLLPLIKESVIVYPSGEEVPVSLHYERLEKHCSKCYRLDHELKDCLEAKAQAKSLKASQEASSNSRHSSRVEELPEKELNSKEHFRFTASKPKDMNNRLYDQRKHHNYDNSRNYSETARRSEIYKEDPRYSRDSRDPRDQNRDWSRRVLPTRPRQRYGYEPYHSRTKPNHMVYREVTRARPAPKPLSISATGEERTLHQPEKRQDDEGSHRDIFGSGHSKQSPAARGVPLRAVTPEINQGALEEALEEVRDAMIMYTQCADPTESAARKERLRQAEAQGEFEETAALMVHASMATMPANNFFPKEPNNALSPRIPATQRLGPSPSSADPLSSPARIPAVQRLGPLNDEAAPSALLPPIAPVKRKPGRPLGKKNSSKQS